LSPDLGYGAGHEGSLAEWEVALSFAVRTTLAFAALSLVLQSAFAAPAVTLAPGVGPPTTSVTVNGTGFGAGALVDVYFDTTHLCLTFATPAGAANCTIRVPKDAQPQVHWISAVQRSTLTGAQKPFTVRTDWPQFHGRNATHNGRNLLENTIDGANAGDLDTLWIADIGPMGTWSTPAVWSGKVYIGGLNGKLYAFNSQTGVTIAGFPKTLGGPVRYASAAVGSGRVFVGTGAPDKKLYAFNANTGAAVAGFPKQLGGAVDSSPALALGNVYVGSGDGKLHAYNASTGALVPGFPKTLLSGGAAFASPSIANGRVYIGDIAGRLYGFDALTGVPLPLSPILLGGGLIGSAAVAGGVVYAGNQNGNLYAYTDSFSRAILGFPVATGSMIESTPALGRGLVIAGTSSGVVYAWPTATGKTPLWTKTLDSGIRGSPVIANELVFVNSQTRLFALSVHSGEPIWSAGVTAAGWASPAVADGTVYLGSDSGRLYAFSVGGEPVSARLPGGALGVRPALSSLKPDYSLTPVR
jgi:outer membrane protein assembly factor BamB